MTTQTAIPASLAAIVAAAATGEHSYYQHALDNAVVNLDGSTSDELNELLTAEFRRYRFDGIPPLADVCSVTADWRGLVALYMSATTQEELDFARRAVEEWLAADLPDDVDDLGGDEFELLLQNYGGHLRDLVAEAYYDDEYRVG